MKRDSYKDNNLAQAYVPFQYYVNSYSPMEALRRGTLFPELYKPYKYKEGRRRRR